MARIALVSEEEASGEVAAVFDVLRRRFHKVPNLFAALARSPAAMRPVLDLFDAVYVGSDLSDRLKELVIVKIAFGLQSHYCLTLHKAFALERGVTNPELRALAEDPTLAGFPEAERVALEYATLYARDAREISDDLFARLRAHYDEGQIVTLGLLVGLGLIFGDLANALELPMDSFVAPPTSSS